MTLHDEFPYARLSPPATPQEIAQAEATLGVKLPEPLREFYLECNGFREELGNAAYLFALFDEDSSGSLVTMTRLYWVEYSKPSFKSFIFFGGTSGGACWGINQHDPSEIIAYHHHMETQYEVVGSKIIDVWKADYASYDEIDL